MQGTYVYFSTVYTLGEGLLNWKLYTHILYFRREYKLLLIIVHILPELLRMRALIFGFYMISFLCELLVRFLDHFSSQLFSFCLLIFTSSLCILGICTLSASPCRKIYPVLWHVNRLNWDLSIFFFSQYDWKALLSFTQVTFFSSLLTHRHCPVRSVLWVCTCHVV